jgi:hypothetical protein
MSACAPSPVGKLLIFSLELYLIECMKCHIDMVIHIYNLSKMGNRNQEDHGSKPSQEKMLARSISANKLYRKMHICSTGYAMNR